MLVFVLSLLWGWRTAMFQLSGFSLLAKSPGMMSSPNANSRPRPPNVALLRALWSLLDGIWGLLRVVGGCWEKEALQQKPENVE